MVKKWVAWVAVLFVVLTSALSIGKTIYDERLQELVYSRHSHLIKTARTLLHEHLMKVVQDTHQLSIISCIQRYLNNPSSQNYEILERTLMHTANVYGRYDQIRIVSLQGKELVRINHAILGAFTVPQNQLQDKLDRYYIQEGLKLKPGQVYLSPLDLNVEHGVIEKPLNPTIRLVRLMINNAGEPAALLVLNYKARGMLNQFIEQFPQSDRAMLLNMDGYWLANHQTENEWGWMLGHPERTLKQWSPELWDAVTMSRTGTFNKDDDLFTFGRIDIANIYQSTSHAPYIRDLGLISNLKASTWTILVQTDRADWQKRAVYNSFWFRAALIGFVLALLSIIYLLVRNQYQHQLNTKLQNQQLANFRDLYENAPIGYITLAADGLITNVNKVLLGYLGYARDDIVNKLYLKQIVDSSSQRELEQFLLTLTDAQERKSRLTMRSVDGRQAIMRCNISLRTEESTFLPIGRCSVQDISEQVRLEKRLENLALKDPLTGLANRRCFDEAAKKEFDRAQRTGNTLTAIALDIDHFKRVNDTYGHAAGDEVLKELAQQCQIMLRSTDIFARMGGEEFVILLPDTSIIQAVEKAESIRRVLAGVVVVLSNGARIQFTVSLGVASLGEYDASIQQLLAAADEALYDAKRSGRNCVKVAL